VTALLLLAAFVLIVVGAIGFTNAVEWLGHRLNLGAGAVGALLAAVGTALPESLIPIVALISGGGEEGEQIAIGAIIGAPFLLGTLAMLLVAISTHGFSRRRDQDERLEPDVPSVRRDLVAFLVLFPIAILLGIGTPLWVRIVAAVLLVGGYVAYAWRTATAGGDSAGDEELAPLYFDTSRGDPPNVAQIILQFLVSLGAIVAGAELFVHEIETVAKSLGVSILVLSLVLAPLATELPEKLNSVLWVREGKDALAMGNITGAMAFQATIPVAIGLVLTDWELDRYAVAAAVAGVLGGLVALLVLPRERFGAVPSVLWGLLFAGSLVFMLVA
jgi:cation:H+ antiporter